MTIVAHSRKKRAPRKNIWDLLTPLGKARLLRHREIRRGLAWLSADLKMDRLYTNHGVTEFDPVANPGLCYRLWLALPKGMLAAMRHAGDPRPVYPHSLADRP